MTQHAKLSASGSERWMTCPGSVNLEANYPNIPSKYAQEGTVAHSIAAEALLKVIPAKKAFRNIKHQLTVDDLQYVTDEMFEHVETYCDYVLSFLTEDTELLVEQKVDFSYAVPGGFGTLDAAIVDRKNHTLHIFDLKYGKGVQVFSEKNSQMMLYAIGACKFFSEKDALEKICMNIIQPRLNHIDQSVIVLDDLLNFADFAKKAAKLTEKQNAPLIPGEKQCKFCKAKANCPALKNLFNKTKDCIITKSPGSRAVITNDEICEILHAETLLEMYVNAVKEEALIRMKQGQKIPEFKLVKAKTQSKWRDNIDKILEKYLGSRTYISKLIGITDAKKILLKEKLMSEEDIEKLIYKPDGEITIAPVSDKREEAILDENLDRMFKKLH